MNISEHTSFFVQEMKRRGFSEQTVENYASCIRKFFEQCDQDHPKNVTEKQIRWFLGKFDQPNTQRAYHSAIKKFYSICLNQKDKFKYIPYCKKSNKLPIVLSVDEIQAMFNVCENLKHKVILAMPIYIMNKHLSLLYENMWNIHDYFSFRKNLYRAVC